jgi:hypothetical protein
MAFNNYDTAFARRFHDMTIRELDEWCARHYLRGKQVWRWVSHEQTPSTNSARRLADALGITVEQLAEELG